MPNKLANVIVQIKNAERARQKEVILTPASKLVQKVLRILQQEAYIGEFERYDDGRQGKFKVALLGRINECRALLRLNYKLEQFEALERELLPAPGLGLIILTTNQGIMRLKDAEERKIGGMTLAVVY